MIYKFTTSDERRVNVEIKKESIIIGTLSKFCISDFADLISCTINAYNDTYGNWLGLDDTQFEPDIEVNDFVQIKVDDHWRYARVVRSPGGGLMLHDGYNNFPLDGTEYVKVTND